MVLEGLVGSVVLFPDPSSYRAKTFDGGAEIGWQQRGNLTTNAGCQLAAFARRRDANLQGSVGMGRRKAEGAQVWAVEDIDWYTQPSTECRYVRACG